ncbi:MAG: 2-oxoglutarate dehydrogenase E1 component [Planctomycetaceae bacterium]
MTTTPAVDATTPAVDATAPARATAEIPPSGSLAFIEQLFTAYQEDATSVSPDWRDYFEDLAAQGKCPLEQHPEDLFPRRSIFHHPAGTLETPEESTKRRMKEVASLQERVDQIIRNYRVRGHIISQVDPLHQPKEMPAELDPAFYGFTDADLDRKFSTSWLGGPERRTLRQILSWLQNTYCRSIGAQFMHIDSLRVRQWLQDRMEGTGSYYKLPRDEQLRIYQRLSDAVIFEEFIQKKYISKKRFSLEGAESLIPLLDMAIEKAGSQGTAEIVLGMAHRGRLNVLANIMGKPPSQIFREFEDADPEAHIGGGDVKYHLGYSSDWTTQTGHKVHLSLAFNPSHLEFINPIVLGRVRAKQDRVGDFDRRRGLALLIHGDAAFAGEGVIQETLNLSQLESYRTGGTLHVVVNNQIGFTTTEEQSRSSTYATDVAKMLQIPIFHVNGEDPEAVAFVVDLALDFRREVQRDVVIDMYCYRRRGHNEGDEPAFTQPLMYQTIGQRPTVNDSYLAKLLDRGEIDRDDADRIVETSRSWLEEELRAARADLHIEKPRTGGGLWTDFRGGAESDEVETGVPGARLAELLEKQATPPPGFTPHPKIEKLLLTARREMAAGDRKIDWGTAESLAFATLAVDGYSIRMTGQDSERGTFSQRHAALHDYVTGERYMPLQYLSENQAPVEIANSPLSEAGVLGFEYGYSLDRPDGLVLWEAQFGDFVNAAQVIIDQFITSAEDKWRRLSGLVLLLPHGFEGQGPEHSSARLERFLMAGADDNMQVAYPSTPDNYFHLLRRQAVRKWRKPLVVMTPKSLLRHPHAVCSLDSLSDGRFMRIIPDGTDRERGGVTRVLLCSGKVYYELDEFRQKYEREDVAIVRVEELYPFPEQALREAFAGYRDDVEVVWVQEEPENMGVWRYLFCLTSGNLFGSHSLRCVSRAASASPATGSMASHAFEQEMLLTEAFRDPLRG